MNDTHGIQVKVVDFAQTPIAVMEHKGAPQSLGRTIAKFIAWRKSQGLSPSTSRTFNLVYDDPNTTAPDDYRFGLGCAVNRHVEASDEDVVNTVIPAGQCAVVRHIGSDEGIGPIVHFLYSTWLADSTYEARDFPLFFERVSFSPDMPQSEMVTDIYLPIQATS